MKIKNKKDYIFTILENLGLTKDECCRDIRKISGGQQQRVAIARAMAKNVDLILCDEPTGNLDEKTSDSIIQTFIDLAHQKNKSIIMDVQLKIKEGKLVEINENKKEAQH